MNAKSPLSFVCVSRLTPVASLTRAIFTPARTAPLGSATRPRILPPVLWARRMVVDTRQNKRASPRAVQRAVDEGMGILRAAGGCFNFQNAKFACIANLAIIAQG